MERAGPFRASVRPAKPIITGEVGIQAGNDPTCESFAQRAVDISNKMKAQFAAGSSAFLVWDWASSRLAPAATTPALVIRS